MEIASAQNCVINPHILVGHQVKTIIEFIKKNKIDLLIIGFIGISAVYERVNGQYKCKSCAHGSVFSACC